jgi:hypothetical protein
VRSKRWTGALTLLGSASIILGLSFLLFDVNLASGLNDALLACGAVPLVIAATGSLLDASPGEIVAKPPEPAGAGVARPDAQLALAGVDDGPATESIATTPDVELAGSNLVPAGGPRPGGILTSRTGRSLPGGILTVIDFDGAEIDRATSDDGGEFTFASLPDGQYHVLAMAAPYIPAVTVLEVEHTRAFVHLVLRGTTTLIGRAIVEDSGESVAGAKVELRPVDGESVAVELTGDDGRFRMEDVEEGVWELSSRTPRYEAAATAVTLVCGEEYRPRRPASISLARAAP